MSKGITRDTAQIWKFLRADKGWWSVLRLTGHWAPTFSLRVVEEHMVTLLRGGFVVSKETNNQGTVYAVTPECLALPGMDVPERIETAKPEVVPPARPNVMSGHYVPPPVSLRPGALDHAQCPSLQQGKRMPYQGARA